MDLNTLKQRKLYTFIFKYKISLLLGFILAIYVCRFPTDYTKDVIRLNDKINSLQTEISNNQKDFKLKVDEENKGEIAKINADIVKATNDKTTLLNERSTLQSKLDEQIKRKADADAAAAKAKAKQEGVHIGMTKQQVLDSNWGKPQKINTTTTKYGTHEQWVYQGYNYLYFDDGILTSIQN